MSSSRILQEYEYLYEFKEGNYTLDEYCKVKGIRERTLLNILYKEASNYNFIKIQESIYNEEVFLLKDKKSKQNICRIQIKECIDTYIGQLEDKYENINKELLDNRIMILKLKFTNLKYESIEFLEEFCDKIYIVDEYQNFRRILKNRSLTYSNIGKEIGYLATYERKYQPKVIYNITLVFPIDKRNRNYLMAIKDLNVDGTVVEKIEYKENETSKKAREEFLSKRCPNCGCSKITKAGHKNGKQRYQCKECNRKFV